MTNEQNIPAWVTADKPTAIVITPHVASLFRGCCGGGWSYGAPSLFGLPVGIDRSAERWSVRLKIEADQG